MMMETKIKFICMSLHVTKYNKNCEFCWIEMNRQAKSQRSLFQFIAWFWITIIINVTKVHTGQRGNFVCVVLNEEEKKTKKKNEKWWIATWKYFPALINSQGWYRPTPASQRWRWNLRTWHRYTTHWYTHTHTYSKCPLLYYLQLWKPIAQVSRSAKLFVAICYVWQVI